MASPSTIDQKSQIVVPASVRRRAGLKLGDEVVMKVSRGVLLIVRKPKAADQFLAALQAMQEEARKHGLDKLSMEDINAEISAYRKEKREKAASRGK
jgi:AbrB family looped-hinge helix DNA binding protein